MNFDAIELLRERHPAWRLLRAGNASLVLSFLGAHFVDGNHGATAEPVLVDALDEHLDQINAGAADVRFPRSPREYLTDWSAPESGWLRRFYPHGSDEVHYDATPALEKAHMWISTLRTRAFVGTESRLHTVVELLRQIVHGTETDQETRLAELRKERDRLDTEIREAELGNFDVLGETAVRDRYQQFARTARELLADFREVEDNFRRFDRDARERIASWDGPKGELLASSCRAAPTSTAPTRAAASRRSTTSSCRRAGRTSWPNCSAVSSRSPGSTPTRGCARSTTTGRKPRSAPSRLSARSPSSCVDSSTTRSGWRTGGSSTSSAPSSRVPSPAALNLRRWASPSIFPGSPSRCRSSGRSTARSPPRTCSSMLDPAEEQEIDVSALFAQAFVDQARLVENIRGLLPSRSSATLHEILEFHPVEQGAAEIIGYLTLNEDDIDVTLDESEETLIGFLDVDGATRWARLPQVTVRRR